MRLTLQPNGRSLRGQDPTSYVVDLPHDDSAIIDSVAGRGWQLAVRHDGAITNRGVFGTTYDILTLLEAEYYPAEN